MKDELKAVVKSLEHSHVSAVGDAEAARVDTNREYCTGKANAFAYALSLLRPVADRLAATPPAASAEAREGVPVAWRSRCEGDQRWLLTEHEPTVPGIEKHPLFTHAPAPELSEEEKRALSWLERSVDAPELEGTRACIKAVCAALRRVAK